MTKEEEDEAVAAAAAAANPAYVEEEVGDLAKDKAGGSKIGRAGADPDPLETAWAFLGLKDCTHDYASHFSTLCRESLV